MFDTYATLVLVVASFAFGCWLIATRRDRVEGVGFLALAAALLSRFSLTAPYVALLLIVLAAVLRRQERRRVP